MEQFLPVSFPSYFQLLGGALKLELWLVVDADFEKALPILDRALLLYNAFHLRIFHQLRKVDLTQINGELITILALLLLVDHVQEHVSCDVAEGETELDSWNLLIYIL